MCVQSNLYVNPFYQLCLSVRVYSIVSMLTIVFVSVCVCVYSLVSMLPIVLLVKSVCGQCILKSTRHKQSSLRSFLDICSHFRAFFSSNYWSFPVVFRSFLVVSGHFQSFPVLRDTLTFDSVDVEMYHSDRGCARAPPLKHASRFQTVKSWITTVLHPTSDIAVSFKLNIFNWTMHFLPQRTSWVFLWET